MINNDVENLSGKNYPNEKTISLWLMRLILSQYKSKNYFQNLTVLFSGAKLVIYKKTHRAYVVIYITLFNQFKIIFFKFISVNDDGNLVKSGVKYPCSYQAERLFSGNSRYRICFVFLFADFTYFPG